MKELDIWNRQLLGTIRGMAPEIAIPRAVPVCHEVRIRPGLVSARQYLIRL